MKERWKQIKKLTFLIFFTLQCCLLVILVVDYYRMDDTGTKKPDDPDVPNVFDDTWEEETATKDEEETKDHTKVQANAIKKNSTKNERKPLHSLFLTTDYQEIPSDAIQDTLKHNYLYEHPKDNIAYIHQLIVQADVCESAWYENVRVMCEILDRQNDVWQNHGDEQVRTLAYRQTNLSLALKEMYQHTNEDSIDLVERCLKDYEAYYFDKFGGYVE